MGVLLGDVPSGLFVGLVLELFHLGSANLGAALPENDTLAATAVSAASAAMANGAEGATPAIWSISILLFVGMGKVGRIIDRALERYTSRLASRAIASAEQGDVLRAVRQNLWGMWPYFVVFGALTSACALAGYALAPFEARLPLKAVRSLAWAYPAMASVAAAIAARGSNSSRAELYAGAAAAVVTCLGAFAVFGGAS
jgi:PTS system mannose-specific IIC component